MKKYLDPALLDFLDESIDPNIKQVLTVSASVKVPCRCAKCHTVNTVTFFSAYRQRIRSGTYVCRSCHARQNGTCAPKGFAKRTQTNLERYGVEHPMMLPSTVQKMYATNQARYGVNRVLEHPQFQEKQHESYIDHFGMHPFRHPAIREQIRTTCVERYGVENPGAHLKTSKGEEDVRTFLETLTGQAWPSDWVQLAPHQLDGYCPELQIAFEYCGLYWHSEPRRSRFSHAWKTQRCRELGITLLTIFEDEWQQKPEQVQAYLASKVGACTTTLYARKTRVTRLMTSLAHRTLAQWHLQGPSSATTHAYGLWYQDALVGVMTFRPHHRLGSHTSAIILSRMAFAPYTRIVGGATKLLAHAKRELCHEYSHIVSWSDNRWSEGHVYRAMGFTCDAVLPPDYSYVRGNIRLTKQSCTKKSLGAVDGQTEHARAIELGLARIWDCGKIRWMCPLRQ